MPSFTTVFGEKDVSLDLPLLHALLGSQEQRPPPTERAPLSARKGDGVSVLDFRRAMGLEIALSRVSASPEAIRSCLRALDFSGKVVGAEDVGLLLGKLPCAEEAQLLLKHAGAPDKLRELERRALPLCQVPDAERRLRLLHIGMSHAAAYSNLLQSFECMHQAASEVLASVRLHNVLRCSLQIANYINHGSLEGAKTFSVGSFSAFASFKLGSSSALHYLCLTLCTADFVRGLKADLEAVFKAARESCEAQQEELRAFSTFATDAEGHLETEADEDARARVSDLLRVLAMELTSLQQAEKRAKLRVEEAQRFLGERAAVLSKGEVFFSHVVDLVRHLEDAQADVAQNPQKWQDLPLAAAATAT